MKNITISKEDIKYLSLIRRNVSNFIFKLSKLYDLKGKILLDIAPQDYEGARGYFKNCIIKTLDINPKSGADYIADLCQNNKEIISDETFDYVL